MKLYYSAGACSLSPHIVAVEAGIALELVRVNLGKTPHTLASGAAFSAVNPNGYVPVLELDDGQVLTEGPAIVQYLADQKPECGLAPAAGTLARAQLQSWLNFIGTELHKMYSPWLFHAEYGEQAQTVARGKIADRLTFVDRHLAAGGPFLMGESFTAADAYLFTVVSWSKLVNVDLSDYPALRAHFERVGRRPAVREAMKAEGLKVAE
ncbi:glutathione transferase GstA [Trinickia sp. NRRL B-1857]|uniref:glutathione transferase GstA n=1 Tax=Trinickia sp. NRRL B-1857 TaxID=3162879 RepID=UPI003D2CD05F